MTHASTDTSSIRQALGDRAVRGVPAWQDLDGRLHAVCDELALALTGYGVRGLTADMLTSLGDSAADLNTWAHRTPVPSTAEADRAAVRAERAIARQLGTCPADEHPLWLRLDLWLKTILGSERHQILFGERY